MASSRVPRQLRASLSALLAMVWFVDHALAQSILHVCPPIRISEITSGLSTTSGVSSDQLDAIDKHHTAYLLRYHSEIESEVRGLAEKTGAQPMGATDMEKTLRAFDQVLTRISECDNQLFDAVVSVLDGDSVSRVARARAMRECSRLLDGYTLRAVRSFGEGVDFVDCIRSVSWHLRESLSTEEDRVQFAAWVDRNQPLLVQHARSLHDAARPAIVAVSVESESRMDQLEYGDDTDESSLTPKSSRRDGPSRSGATRNE